MIEARGGAARFRGTGTHGAQARARQSMLDVRHAHPLLDSWRIGVCGLISHSP